MVGVVFYEVVVFFVFIGFDARKKRKIHKKGMPIGILGSLVICFLYVLFAYVLTGLENYLNFLKASPVTTAKNSYTFLNSTSQLQLQDTLL
jgi:APA family basic amino acid/polyamine antiporter